MKKIALILLCLGLFSTIEAVPFKLVNTGFKSIYLEIPGVMNPNLSPLSRSGVGLAIGQKIYYYRKGQRFTLLTVDESIRNENINVRKLIKQQIKKD
jgi:hypothetical protein